MEIKIRKRPHAEWLVLYIFILPFAFFLLTDIFHLPSAINYTLDVVWILLLVLMLISKVKLPNRQATNVMFLAGMFFLVSLFGFLLEYQSVAYYLWGLRNNARFFVFMAACILILSKQSADSYLQIMDRLYIVNFAVVLFQFFVMKKKQDTLGGIFGVAKGCNAYINVFMLVVITWHILQYMNKKETFKKCIAYCLISLLISALAELKAFYIEFILVIILTSLITKFSWRKLGIIIVATLAMILSLQLLVLIFPLFKNWFSFAYIWESLTTTSGYTNSYDMNRLTAIPIALERYLETWPQKLFGLGLGNCDYATGFDFLTTPFYKANRHMHYYWFSSAFVTLETGLVGFTLYIGFFIKTYFGALKQQKSGLADVTYCQLARIMAIMCLVLIFYDGSLRTEAGFMVYFVLSLPFLRNNSTYETATINHQIPREA